MNTLIEARYQKELIALTMRSDWLMDALIAARKLALPSWCIGAGAIRAMVWDALHGYSSPSAIPDIDLAYFDPSQSDKDREDLLRSTLPVVIPGARWEITNQAHVHSWYEREFGKAVEPLHSLEEGVASWPEFATAVGITLKENDSIEVISPHGLNDLFAMVVRHNPARATYEAYQKRLKQKQYADRWPKVKVYA